MAFTAGQKLRASELAPVEDIEDIMAGQAATVSTAQTTTSTSYTDLTTVGPSVNVTLNEARTVLVILYSALHQQGAVNPVYASFAASGATTIASSDSNSITHNGTGAAVRESAVTYHTLNAGTTTLTMKYRAAAGTAEFFDRKIMVKVLS